ncbi:MAG: hypothetical protein Q9226_009027 [Calogaya cf. arnoldii]
MPNSYAGDIEQVQLGVDTLVGPVAQANREEIEKLGMQWIAVCCGFWYDYSLAGGEARFGFDFDKHTLTIYDDGQTKNSVSTLAQVGRAVAKVLSFPLFPQDENDTSLTISSWFNKAVYLQSFVVNQNEIFESVKRVTGTTDADWTVTHENTKQRYEGGMALVKKGNMSGFGKLLYSRAFYPEDPSNCAAKAQNELLGLPEEKLDDATKDGIELVKELQKRPEPALGTRATHEWIFLEGKKYTRDKDCPTMVELEYTRANSAEGRADFELSFSLRNINLQALLRRKYYDAFSMQPKKRFAYSVSPDRRCNITNASSST